MDFLTFFFAVLRSLWVVALSGDRGGLREMKGGCMDDWSTVWENLDGGLSGWKKREDGFSLGSFSAGAWSELRGVRCCGLDARARGIGTEGCGQVGKAVSVALGNWTGSGETVGEHELRGS